MKSNATSTIGFVVAGEPKLHCSGCEERVTKVLRQLTGVESVDASSETQDVQVTFDNERVQQNEILTALQRMGYNVETGNGQQSREPSVESQGSRVESQEPKNEGAELESDHPRAERSTTTRRRKNDGSMYGRRRPNQMAHPQTQLHAKMPPTRTVA